MGSIVYALGTLTSLVCALLLLRGYIRGRRRLLLWSGLCFLGLAVHNLLILLDLVVFPEVDLFPARLGTTVFSMGLLLYGLIWESN
jgi:hypothetical protein